MAVLKLSQITTSSTNFTTGDFLVAVQGGTTDVLMSYANIWSAPKSLTGSGHAGTTVFSVLPDSGAAFIKLNDNGTMVIDSDVGSGSNPLLLKYNGNTRFSFDFNANFVLTGTAGSETINLGGGVVVLDSKSLNLFEISSLATPGGVANTARLFAQDNGAGKTQLMVVFGSGSPIQVAIEV